MERRAEQILPSPLGPTNLRPRRRTCILWRRGGQPRPNSHGLREGGLRGGPGTGGRGMWPPGYLPCQGCLFDAGKPPLPGVLDEEGRRVCPAVGLRHGGSPVGEPPVQPPGGSGGEGGTRGISHADHFPGIVRPPVPVVDHAVRPVPQAVAAPPRPATLPAGRHGSDASSQVANVGHPDGLPGGVAVTHAPTTRANPHPTGGPPSSGAAPGRGPGRATYDGAPPHGHTAPRDRPRKVERKRYVLRFLPAGPSGDSPSTRSGSRLRPSSLAPPPPRHVGLSSTRWWRLNQARATSAGRTSLGRSCARGPPGNTDGDRPRTGKRGRAGGRRGRPKAPPPQGP